MRIRNSLTTEEILRIILMHKRDGFGEDKTAKTLNKPVSTIGSAYQIIKKYWDNTNIPIKSWRNETYLAAVGEAKKILGREIADQPYGKAYSIIEPPLPPSDHATNLTIKDIIKIIYLRKKQNKTFTSIALQINKPQITVWSCFNSIENKYWTADPNTISMADPRYLTAVLAAKELLVEDKDPFKDDLTKITGNAEIEVRKIYENKKAPLNITTSTPIQPLDTEDLFQQFEKDIIKVITTFVTKLVSEKQEVILVEKDKVTEENQKLIEENNDLKKRNDDLTRKLLSQKQSSLADSLKSSFQNI